MSRLTKTKKQKDKARYNLHYRIKQKHPYDSQLLDPIQRCFKKTPQSNMGKKLVNEFGYSILTSILN